MAKGVLGNDPFRRGAAPRPAPPTAPGAAQTEQPSDAEQAALPGAKADPEAPAPARKGVKAAGKRERDRRELRSGAAGDGPRVPPSDTAPSGRTAPLARPASTRSAPKPSPAFRDVPSPERVRASSEPSPIPHPDSPRLRTASTPHEDSPELIADISKGPPVPHPGSPRLRAASTPHEGSPDLVADVSRDAPVAHPDSPRLRAASTPHEGSPELVADVTGRAGGVPHPGSPELQKVTTPFAGPAQDATSRPHPASPELIADVSQERGVPHPASPELVGAAAILPTAQRQQPAPLVMAHGQEERTGALPVATIGGRVGAAARGLLKAVQTAVGLGGAPQLDAYGRDPGLVGALQPMAEFLYDRYWRVSVHGAQNLPSGPCIVVANHSGALPFDGPVLHMALSRSRPDLHQSRWLVEDQVFHAPFLGSLVNRLGAVRACPENAVRLLGEGRPVLVFPEGIQGIGKRFAHRYRLMRFGRGGYVKLALRAGVPIVPAAILGAEETSPLLWRVPGKLFGLPYLPVTPFGPVPLPAKWTIRFAPPVRLGPARPEAAEDLAEVQRLNELCRQSIQGMLTALLSERRSVFAS